MLLCYDVHGNVDTLLQDFGNSSGTSNVMNGSGNRFKKMSYDFDLISGKVNQVSYQVGHADAYYQRYNYDAENRLTDVYSGKDSIILMLFPEREAHYSYYAHGPLARTDLGQLRVQGLDYAYTLQGWMKGINPVMGGSLSNGNDTTEQFPVSQDVYGFSLHYYSKDYRAIGYAAPSTGVLDALTTNAASLFNGNIAAMAVNIPKIGNPLVYNYHYDQLNRIFAMDAYQGLNDQNGTFTPVSLSAYQERVSYDPNGNILKYNRHGDAARISMDSLTYTYKPKTNQLDEVADAASDASPTDYPKYNDIKQGQSAGNYQYDAIGNLISDASESITNITWNVYGKIASLTKSGQTISYIYDASGNRTMKATSSLTTAYVRDATGNVMSVYTQPTSGALVQSEMDIYGSSRLGMATQHLNPDTAQALSAVEFDSLRKSMFTRSEKLFELSNHLGNVLVTIDDRRIQKDSNADGNVDTYIANISSANDYYPFGMMMPARNYAASTSYKYGFNGKENDKDISNGGQDYGMRIYDNRLGKFLSVDPITKKYPELTPYQFSSNTPIQAVDLDGLEKFDIITTSFAPFDIFGKDFFGGYYGDGESRKFGDAPFSISGDIGKYRTMGAVSFDISSMRGALYATTGATTSTYHRKNWNPLSDYTATSPTNLEFENYSSTSNSLSFKFHTYGSDQAVFTSNLSFTPVPNIDNHVDVKITKVGTTRLNVIGHVSGDQFPSNETYLRDQKGGILILGASGANRGQEGPYFSLWRDSKKSMSSFSLDILLNNDDTFKGVQLKNKFFTPEEWNKQFFKVSPKESKGTKTGDSGVSTQTF